DVLNFGAKGDGSTDDTQAFQKAWTEACSSSADVNFVVPGKKNYHLKPIRFSGPCMSDITMQIVGTIIASNDRSDYSKDLRHWLTFDSVQNLVVAGGGIINGNGNIWWQNSCKINKAKALTFYQCTNLVVKNLKVENAQQIHMSFEKCTNVQASNLVVTAPENSPNTDGIHVTGTQNIQISSCTIGTGDDCISIVSGSQKVQAMGITCGPGHGISIGSLGSGNSEEYVTDVLVNGAKLSGTTNGVRIKTWQGGSGSASNIKFQNIEMQNVKNPIIIDQQYCDQDKPCQEQGSAVQVKNVVYQNIKGTSASDILGFFFFLTLYIFIDSSVKMMPMPVLVLYLISWSRIWVKLNLKIIHLRSKSDPFILIKSASNEMCPNLTHIYCHPYLRIIKVTMVNFMSREREREPLVEKVKIYGEYLPCILTFEVMHLLKIINAIKNSYAPSEYTST
ncbi:hypothetical protein Pfo_028242, partial [Paulownia fortunei]